MDKVAAGVSPAIGEEEHLGTIGSGSNEVTMYRLGTESCLLLGAALLAGCATP